MKKIDAVAYCRVSRGNQESTEERLISKFTIMPKGSYEFLNLYKKETKYKKRILNHENNRRK